MPDNGAYHYHSYCSFLPLMTELVHKSLLQNASLPGFSLKISSKRSGCTQKQLQSNGENATSFESFEPLKKKFATGTPFNDIPITGRGVRNCPTGAQFRLNNVSFHFPLQCVHSKFPHHFFYRRYDLEAS